MCKKIYISGKITGDPKWEGKFAMAQAELEADGWTVLSPLLLADVELEYNEYLAIDFAMISVCDAVGFLPDWGRSPGAMAERTFAAAQGKQLIDMTVGVDEASADTIACAGLTLIDAVNRQCKIIKRLFERYVVPAAVAKMAFFGTMTMSDDGKIQSMSTIRVGHKDALRPEWERG